MSLNKAIITPAEADAILTQEAAWLALTDTVKEYHIAFASVYMQLNWLCTDVDWDDDTTITAEQEEACAYYALASSNGNLYSDTKQSSVAHGLLQEETKKLGSLVKTVKYHAGSDVTVDPLQYPNMLMWLSLV